MKKLMTMKTPESIIIYNNEDYLIAQKPAGMLSMRTENEAEQSFSCQLKAQLKVPFHALTRLDRPVGGLLICSLSKSFHDHYLKLQSQGLIEKTYICIVEGSWTDDPGTLKHFHHHDKKFRKARIFDEKIKNETEVILDYKIMRNLDNYTIIEAKIKTGKFHQIRAQLSKAGYPVKGDVKYGARRSNKDKSIYMHAYKINFTDQRENHLEYKSNLPLNDTLWKLAAEAVTS